MAYKIQDVEGIGPAYAEKLANAGIKTTDDLLKQCGAPTGRQQVCTTTGFTENQVLKWVNMADLMRISGIGGEYAELLEAAGVDTVNELKMRNPTTLAERMQQINEVKNLTRSVPPANKIAEWIEQAKKTTPMITH